MKKLLINLFKFLLKKVQESTYKEYREKYRIHKSFKFNGDSILLLGDGDISCGADSYIGIGSSVSSNKGYHVTIGKRCAISHNVRIYNNTYLADSDFTILPVPVKYGSVEIEDGVWIGANAVILPGVKIGTNSVIGANSVVISDIPPFSIASGIPCKVIRYKQLNGN